MPHFRLLDPWNNEEANYVGPDAEGAVRSDVERLSGDGWTVQKLTLGNILGGEVVKSWPARGF